jgi:hypothetical protein
MRRGGIRVEAVADVSWAPSATTVLGALCAMMDDDGAMSERGK